jgi:hypothetical protein
MSIVTNITDDCMIINGLYVDPIHRGNNIAIQKLHDVALLAMKHKLIHIRVDDMSNNYRKSHNIYTLAGFIYDDPISGPEMTGRSSTIARTTRQWLLRKKKLNRSEFVLRVYDRSLC